MTPRPSDQMTSPPSISTATTTNSKTPKIGLLLKIKFQVSTVLQKLKTYNKIRNTHIICVFLNYYDGRITKIPSCRNRFLSKPPCHGVVSIPAVKSMEAEKRKRQDDGEADGKRRRAEEEDDGAGKTTTVTEEEVEEFFAILRRIHVAANYLKRRDGRLTAEGRRAITTGEIETEDLDGVKEGVGKGGEDDSVESKTGLDLNLEPPSM